MIARTYSEEEKMAYVADFKESGISIRTYAKEKDIPDTTLRGWLKLDRAMAFAEINIKPETINPLQIPPQKNLWYLQWKTLGLS